jgi:hypothetical protein
LGDLAELAFTTFWSIKWDNMVTNFDIRDTLTDRLDNSTSFVSADYRKGTFGIFTGKCIGIGVTDLIRSALFASQQARAQRPS